jgi:hypothetical protein
MTTASASPAAASRLDRLVPVIAIVGGLAVLAAVAIALGQQSVQVLGSNAVPQPEFARTMAPRERICQAEPLIPAGTTALRLRIGTYGDIGRPVRVEVLQGKRVVRSSQRAGGWTEGDLDFAVAPLDSAVRDARVCVTDLGTGRIALAGYNHQFRIDYAGRPSQTWWDRLGQLERRYSQGKASFLGGWSFVLTFLLVLAAGIVALVTLVRRAQ